MAVAERRVSYFFMERDAVPQLMRFGMNEELEVGAPQPNKVLMSLTAAGMCDSILRSPSTSILNVIGYP
ncbi:MAG: hypothetical protein EXQ69_07495 [Acidimicrobiia bacterium]|nr:hypothetical protein [Acidimicrobiia bacterium]